MSVINLNLSSFKKARATAFTGRPEGSFTRKEARLDELDCNNDVKIEVIIPKNTSSINPSFFLGLFFKSYADLGEELFLSKYLFNTSNLDDDLKKVISKDIKDGINKCRIYSKMGSVLDDLD